MTAQLDAPAPADPDRGAPGPTVRWPVFVTSFVGVCLITLWAIVAPTNAESVIGDLVGRVGTGFGWFYVALATVIVGFVIFLGASRYGSIRLGPDHSRPEFSTFAWASMLFAAGIGTDVMFYSVIEPVSQYTAPPVGEPGTVDAAREATVWTLFHYGVTGWAMYALMGLALAYFSYRKNLPLAVRSALHPVFGKRIDGPLGHAVDTAAVLGTIFGVATSLGIGVVFLNVGLNVIFGVPVGTGAQAALAVLAVTVAAVSATTGVDKGIRFLSQLNVLLALALAGWVLVTGRTSFLLNAVVMNVGDFIRSFPAKSMETFAFTDTQEWMELWTLFFWAWWVAWASFVGLFLARISRGRTIRQFVLGTMVIPFSYIVMWISIFGNAAIDKVRGGDEAFAEAAVDFTGVGFYDLLRDYPLADVVVFLAVVVGLLFYITSADSAALVMGNLCSELRDVQQDCAAWLRITWASATGLLTVAMLAVGGILALQYATIIMGLPFAFVLVLVMWGLFRSLRNEGRKAEGVRSIAPLLSARTGSTEDNRKAWKARLARAINFVDDEAAAAYLVSTVRPALVEVAEELSSMGVPAAVTGDGTIGGHQLPWVQLATDLEADRFVYRVEVRRSPVPTYGGRMIGNRDQYARLEVHLADGGQDYDVMGYTAEQVIHDCLDQYERHLEFLRAT
ncbi:choline BCCT transporter BetT [Nocardioides ganghwensis]|jgi:choline/glycine/proline betaine transport protein|uniref:BCCT family transporter n=1 Tax=Nocardioides ganghwensis TaxID=252230 RepID=A0A4Q2S8Y6_9ACTN|nr:choline BCCT transporter BetT [Nocardioides ganghwensis]MBD3948113.1 choline BCCT transporter BetT [Nocardioides ganghwensis]RYB97263.1 BCCT family transporter [Nocardioides ganghwensis]